MACLADYFIQTLWRPSGAGFWILDDMTDLECDVTVPHVVVITGVVVVEVAIEVEVVAMVTKRLA